MQAQPDALARQVDDYLRAGAPILASPVCPKVLIAPHAGHLYSGQTAGRAYGLLAPFGQRGDGSIRRVVLLGPAHRVYVPGIALAGVDAFATPLGQVPVSAQGSQAISDIPEVVTRADVHAAEHSLEVHLPFLQRVLGTFEVLPLVVGDASPSTVTAVLERLWGGSDVLVVISTDLSHFHTYAQANAIDQASCAQIMALDAHLGHEQACGATPLNGLLALARAKGLRIEQLERCNSGDTGANTPQGRARVVGYASFALYEPQAHEPGDTTQLDNEQGARLVRIARHALNQAVGAPDTAQPVPEADFQAFGASFVTLSCDGQLRGCIGSLQPQRTLAQDVRANAAAAALNDPRFAPVQANELDALRVEVSVLTPPHPVHFANEAHALWQLQPGMDGVVFSVVHAGRSYRSTFLPQVWEQLPSVQSFMAQLKVKAGLSADFWSPSVQLSVYRVQKFLE